MNTTNYEVLETLKCPNCFNYMTDLIYECISGHSVCESCSATDRCPTCKGGITDIRNHNLENISKVVYFPCVNEGLGCGRQFLAKEWKEHMLFCDFRNYICRIDEECNWEGTRNEMKKHCLDNHENKVLLGRECVRLWNRRKPEYEVNLLLAFEQQFYVHRLLRNGTMYWAIQYIGRQEDIILYCYQIIITTNQFNNRSLIFSEICHDDIKDDPDEIIETGFCVGVPLTVLETYMNGEGVVLYKIRIRKA